MALSILDDKSKQPDNKDLARVLNRTKQLWDELINYMAREYGPTTKEWGFSGEKYGWSLRLKQKKRTILYLILSQGYFLCAFVFGEKATEAARQSALPKETTINEARAYTEGRGFRLEVKNKSDVGAMKKLAAIKTAN